MSEYFFFSSLGRYKDAVTQYQAVKLLNEFNDLCGIGLSLFMSGQLKKSYQGEVIFPCAGLKRITFCMFYFLRFNRTTVTHFIINPLRPNSDLSQTSHCNIKGLSVSEVMRIENMIAQVKFY